MKWSTCLTDVNFCIICKSSDLTRNMIQNSLPTEKHYPENFLKDILCFSSIKKTNNIIKILDPHPG